MDNGIVAHASTTVEAPISAVWDALRHQAMSRLSCPSTRTSLSQDNNATEQTREHSEKNWNMALAGLKKVVEQRP